MSELGQLERFGVTGLGGFYFESPDAPGLRNWYRTHLGLEFSPSGHAWFGWKELASDQVGRTAFVPVDAASEAFDPGSQPFMVAYRVADLDALLAHLRTNGQPALDEVAEREDGRVGWVLDPEGQKVELWEPADASSVEELAEPPFVEVPAAGQITGIGGVFLRSPDVTSLKAWYREQLGVLPGEDGYVVFGVRELDDSATYAAWEIFPAETTYFDSAGVPSNHPFMVNFRVRDLAALVGRLRDTEVWVDPNTEEYEFGKFAWIKDPTGARIELWEPTQGH